MKFVYQARTEEGKLRSGTVEAATREAAVALLQRYGLYVTSLKEEKAPFWKKLLAFQEVKRKELVLFFRQLAVMFQSGVPPVEAFHTLANQIKSPSFKEKISQIAEEIESGTPFSQALTLYPNIFSTFVVNMIKSGEKVGRLPETLNYLADYLEREYHFRSRIIGALTYPTLVVIVFILILIGMIFFVMPQLIDILQSVAEELPPITKVTIAVTEFLRSYGIIILGGIFLIVIFLYSYYKTEKGKKFFDRLFLKVPVLNTLLKKIYLARLGENLSTLIAGGLPIIEALEITADVIGNSVYREVILKTKDEVKKGEPISYVFQQHPEVISPFFTQLTIVGEKTGKLDSILKNIVEFYQKEVEIDLEAFLSILEPLIIIMLGVLVGGLVGSILLPMYQISMGG